MELLQNHFSHSQNIECRGDKWIMVIWQLHKKVDQKLSSIVELWRQENCSLIVFVSQPASIFHFLHHQSYLLMCHHHQPAPGYHQKSEGRSWR